MPRNPTFSLLRMLARGDALEVAEMSAALGLGPADVRQCLAGLPALGLQVAQPAPGVYRLVEPVDLLDRDELACLLAAVPWPFRVEILDECESTSTLLLARAAEGAPSGSVVIAEHQTAGRGRRGNAWLSAVGGSLAFSLLWRFPHGVAGLSGLGLAAAVAVARGLETQGVPSVGLKWPNDLMLDGRKVGGILVELCGSAKSERAAVIGVGINLKLGGALRSLLPDASDLAGYGPLSRTRLLAALLDSLAGVLADFGQRGFAAVREQWQARHVWQGRRVTLNAGGAHVATGIALGVAEDGALLIDAGAGVRRFHSGELSLRPA